MTFKREKSSLASGGDWVVSVEAIRRTEGGRKARSPEEMASLADDDPKNPANFPSVCI